MANNRHLARSISDMGRGKYRSQLEYKTPLHNAQLNILGRFEPSSKSCKCRKTVKTVLTIGEQVFVCNACGYIAGRDLNASRSIDELAQAMSEVTPVERRSASLGFGLAATPLMEAGTGRSHFCTLQR